jgi:4'-phosphopantetheinyl transferase EntD
VLAFERPTSFGQLVGVRLDRPLDEGALFDEERAEAAVLSGARHRGYVGGRIALRRALELAGARPGPVPTAPRGGPRVPRGASASISHKGALAVALAEASAASEASSVGVDLEADAPLRVDISRRVLTEREIDAARSLPQGERARRVRISFSVKEAIYKAIDPFVRRYVGFHEVELSWAGAAPSARPLFAEPLVVDVAFEPLVAPNGEPMILAFARARPRA